MQDSPIRLTYSRTGCRGTCPSYEVSFFPDGIITFHGMYWKEGESVPTQTLALSHFSSTQWNNLVSLFTRLAQFGDQYDQAHCHDVTDHPSVRVNIRFPSFATEARHYLGCRKAPAELKEVESLIEKQYIDSVFLQDH